MNVALLEREFEATKQKGLSLFKATAETCEAAGGREMTDEEIAAIKTLSTEAQTLKARLDKAKGNASLLADLEQLTVGGSGSTLVRSNGHGARRLSLGEQWLASEGHAFVKAGGHRSQSAWRSPGVELDPYWGMPHWMQPRAATLTEDPASGGALIVPQYLPGILQPPPPRLLIADLMSSGTTDSNLITYMKEKTWTNAADTVAEGAVKPESTLTFEAVSDPVRKIATWLPVTDEMLEDAPAIRSYIDARLRLGVQIVEEDQLLNGTGVAPDILGLLLRTGLGADVARVDPATNADVILQQMMNLFNASLFMPDGIIMNPLNWTSTLLTKTTTGEYLTPGPFSPIQTPTLWGLPVAVTPATAAGTAVVGAFKMGSQVFRKGGIRVEASNSHADYWIKNLVAIRSEERLALAVYRPGAFGKCTGLT